MGEIEKSFGQWMLDHLELSIIVILFILSCLFKITKREIDPLGWVVGWIGKKFTKDVRQDVSNLRDESHAKFDEIKKDRAAKIEELKNDYNEKISALRTDLDAFEERTNSGIDEMKNGTAKNCELLKKRMNEMEAAQQRSNDMQTIMTIRAHVLDFANSCYNKRKHTKREFDNIIDENSTYEKLVEKHDVTNDVYKEDFAFVMKVYHRCQEEGTFLKEGDV